MNAAHATASGVFARRNKSWLKDLIEPAEKLLSERTVILEPFSQLPFEWVLLTDRERDD